MKLVYIAGPYRADTINGVYENIQRARAVAVKVAKEGDFPVCPHMNTALMDGINDDEFWLEGTMKLMEMCDEVLCIKGWQDSRGTIAEVDRAADLRIPIRYA